MFKTFYQMVIYRIEAPTGDKSGFGLDNLGANKL